MSLPGELQPKELQPEQPEFHPERPEPIRYALENLRVLYSADDAVMLDTYQKDAHHDKTLLNEPVPTKIKNPEADQDSDQESDGDQQKGEETTRFEALCWNNAIYDDRIEAFLDKDPLYKKLMELRSRGAVNEYNLLRAMRSRRSILALIYSYAVEELMGSEPDDTLGETPAEQSA